MLLHLRSSLSDVVRRPGLRRLLFESMGFGGFFKATSGFLQPILAVGAIPVTAALLPAGSMTPAQRSVMLVGPVYFVLFLLSALASRRSHKLVSTLGGEEPAARALWGVNLIIFALLLPASLLGYMGLIIFLFITLFALQNIWRPILVSRFDNESQESQGATILSIESQGKSLATMVFAPLLGFLVDSAAAGDMGATPFWPVALLGSLIAFGFVFTAKKPPPPTEPPAAV